MTLRALNPPHSLAVERRARRIIEDAFAESQTNPERLQAAIRVVKRNAEWRRSMFDLLRMLSVGGGVKEW